MEFGFWILDFGFWILVWMRPYPTSFGSCIRYFHVTPTRVGGFFSLQNNKPAFQPPLAVAPVPRQLAKGLEEDSQRHQLFQKENGLSGDLGEKSSDSFVEELFLKDLFLNKNP